MNDRPKLVPREDFARFLDSQEHTAMLCDYLVSRLAVPCKDRAYERFELIAYMRIYHSYSEKDMRRLISEQDDPMALCIAGLRDKETGAMYNVGYGARYLFEAVEDLESALHPETPILEELRNSVSQGIASLADDGEVASRAKRAATEKGYVPYYRRTRWPLARRVAAVYVEKGRFDCDLIDELVRRCSPEHFWAIDLMDILIYGDETPIKRVEEFLASHEEDLGTMLLDLEHWTRIVRKHGDTIEQVLRLNRSVRSALEPLEALSIHLVFQHSGKEIDLKAKTSTLLARAKEPTPMKITESDVDGSVPRELLAGKGKSKINMATLKAIRFRGRDVWTSGS